MPGMRSLLAATVASLTVLLTAGCAAPAQPTTPLVLTERLLQAGSWKVHATWEWGAGATTVVRMTGYGQWARGGSVRSWNTRWNGTKILTVITPGQVLTEDGEVFSSESPEGRYRSESDLFASADPLTMATRLGLVLHGDAEQLSGRADCTNEHGRCLARLDVRLDQEGRPARVQLVVTRAGWTDLVLYRISDIGR